MCILGVSISRFATAEKIALAAHARTRLRPRVFDPSCVGHTCFSVVPCWVGRSSAAEYSIVLLGHRSGCLRRRRACALLLS
eukprot:4781860-Pleurochrysis_carterae.AAC.1